MIADLLLLLVGLLPFAVIGFLFVRALRRTSRHDLLKAVLFLVVVVALYLLVKLMADRWGRLFMS
jgi:NhaP-type Na+/H+ or K+/H+ antiporter